MERSPSPSISLLVPMIVAGSLALLTGCNGATFEVLCLPGHELMDGMCQVKEVYFEGGWFTMGRGYCSPPEEHAEEFVTGICQLSDEPHEVYVEPFYLDATEVTAFALARGLSCDTSNGANCQEGTDPTWAARVEAGSDIGDARERNLALGYCESLGKTLPTEAQWEFAASGGGERTFPWGEEPPSCDRVTIDSTVCNDATLLVGRHPPSPEGVYDLAGNMAEIVMPSEAFTEGYPPLPLDRSDACQVSDCTWDGSSCNLCRYEGLRGSADDMPPESYRAAHRWTYKNLRMPVGFRCARNP